MNKRFADDTVALAVVTSVFFMWGFITVLNDVLIPHLKALFTLSYAEAMLIQFIFFGAYFVMSLPAGRVIERFGYRSSIVIGLAVTGLGALLFVPAARLDERVIGQLGAIIGSTPSFRVVLRETGRLHGAAAYLYLAPDPAEPFIRLTEAIVARFPEHRPYDGEFAQVIPHLTVAQGEDSLLDEAEREVVGGLPVESVVS